MRIQVELQIMDHGMPLLRAIDLHGRRVEVVEMLDQWYGPDYRYIKVRGLDGALYILKFFESRGDWELTMFDRAQTRVRPSFA
jgi:hypothetical protein